MRVISFIKKLVGKYNNPIKFIDYELREIIIHNVPLCTKTAN